MACSCEGCEEERRTVWKVVKSGRKRHLRKLLLTVYNSKRNLQTELEHKNAILDGSWPGAVTILEHALAKARAQEN